MELARNNSTTAKQFITNELTFERPISIAFISVNLLVITLGIFINSVVIHLYRRRKISHSLFNFFLMNLGISNIIQNIGALPFVIYFHRSVEDLVPIRRNDLICWFVRGAPVFWVAAFVTMQTLAFMNVQFYHIIKKPFLREDKRNFVYHIIAFWLVDFASLAPNFMFFKYDKINGFCRRISAEHWTVQLYKSALYLFGFFIPLCIIIVTYALIIREFYIKSKIGYKAESPVKVKYRKNVVVFLGALIFLIFVTSLPLGVVFILITVTNHSGPPGDPRFEVRITRLLKLATFPCCCTAILNVAFYAGKDVEIRNGFKYFFGASSDTRQRKK
ncbi:galanin receptor type 1-like [Clytia hemisphaerica]|uniref:galanin receptor type 1-like n=1 Tax=Clytia hemisphaerica TaxID=252671 RepID=UPI0034D426D9